MLEGCVTKGNDLRTRAAIMRYVARETFQTPDEDGYTEAINAAWHLRNNQGCKSCGVFRKFGNAGYCRRCRDLRRLISDKELIIAATVPYLTGTTERQRREEIKCLKNGKKTLLQIKQILRSQRKNRAA